MDYEKQEKHIQQLLESVPSEPDICTPGDDEADDQWDSEEELDCVEERNEDSLSEQSLDSNEEDDGDPAQDLISTQLSLSSLVGTNNDIFEGHGKDIPKQAEDLHNNASCSHHDPLSTPVGKYYQLSGSANLKTHGSKTKRTACTPLQPPKKARRGKKLHPGYEQNCLFVDGKQIYFGKDGTKWEGLPRTESSRTRKKNIVTQLPTVREPLRLVTNSLEIWKKFFDNSMMDLMVTCTNKEISRVKNNYVRATYARPTNENELQALIGILLLSGVQKSNKLNFSDLFSSNGTSPEIFRLAMSEQRFKFLLRYLSFDDKETRPERKKLDRLAPIREFFDTFVANCKKNFSMTQYVTVDEKLEGFRGRCAFRQYIPSKPARYGVKIFGLCDAKLYYTANMEVYVGKQPPGPYGNMENSGLAIVDRLCEPIYGTGRNVTTDNWFTSISLCDKLLTERNLTMVGTIKKNKPEIPKIFTEKKNRPVPSTLFGFKQDCTLVSHVPKEKKNVLLISSMHDSDEIDESTQKPEIIMHYNRTKGGVDVVDRLCANYNCARMTRRWPMVVFYSVVNVAGINTQVVYSFNTPLTKVVRRKFLSDLAFSLIKDHIIIRAGIPQIPRTTRQRIAEICGIALQNEQNEDRGIGRCKRCSSSKNRKTKYYCRICKQFLCLQDHARIVCDDC